MMDAERVRRILAAYDEACADWRAAVEDDSESVRDAERYSEALEQVAHDLADAVRPLV